MERVAEIGAMVYYHDRESGDVPAIITGLRPDGNVALVIFDGLKTGGRHAYPAPRVAFGEDIGQWRWPPDPITLFDAMIQGAADHARLRRTEPSDT